MRCGHFLCASLPRHCPRYKQHRFNDKWDIIRYSSCVATCNWCMGRLWLLEVSSSTQPTEPSLIHPLIRPNITIFFTFVAVSVSFAWLGVEDPSKWQAGVALYILGRKFNVSYLARHSLTMFGASSDYLSGKYTFCKCEYKPQLMFHSVHSPSGRPHSRG